MNLVRRPLRSALTVVGVAVGMTVVVGLLSLSAGVRLSLERQLARFGHDLVLILPDGSRGLTPSETVELDLDRIESLPGAASAGALLRRTHSVSTEESEGFLAVMGLSPATFEEASRFFGRYEVEKGSLPRDHEVLLTPEAARELGVDVGDALTVGDRRFRVSGRLAPTGDSRIEGTILMPLESLWALTKGDRRVSLAWARAASGVDVQQLAAAVEARLSSTGQSYHVESAERLNRIVQTVMRVLVTALTGVSAIALLAGGLGLANTMYTAVAERAREIGIYRALGARRGQVLALYLIEATLLGFMGGVLGALFGVGLAASVAALIEEIAGVPAIASAIDPAIVVTSLLLSIGLGALAGALPARRAASLRPVQALRNE